MRADERRELVRRALPGTTAEIALAAGLCHGTAYHIVQSLRAANEIHAGGWRHLPSGRGNLAGLWVIGPGPDVARPEPSNIMKRNGYVRAGEGRANMEMVYESLPGTRVELAVRTGLSISTVRNHLLRLTVAKRAVFERFERRCDVGASSARYVRVEHRA